ncbi:Archaeal ATPase, partial [mine drainage metagenome]
KRLIKKDDPSIIQQYLENLLKIGIIKKVELFKKKRFAYKIGSPLSRLFYYADEKYGISERKLSEEEAIGIIGEVMPRIVEDNIREHLSDKYGLRESVAEASDYEVDGILLKFSRPYLVLEVKWKTKISNKEINEIEKKLSGFKDGKKDIVCTG